MTIYQILALLLCGSYGLIEFANLIIVVAHAPHTRISFSLWRAFVMILCGVIVACTFLGVTV